MEVAPRYWQDPSTLRDIYVSTSGANPSGTQSSNLSVASYSAVQRGFDSLDDRGGFGAQSGDQFARRQRPLQRLLGFGGLDLGRDDDSALGLCEFRARPRRAQRQSSGPVRRLDDFVQHGAGPRRQRSAVGDRTAAQRIGMPSTVRGALRRNRRDLATSAIRTVGC